MTEFCYRVYASVNALEALVSFLHKGVVQKKMHFFVYDPTDSIRERIWTFSQSSFIPNVTINDELLKNNNVPVVITTKMDDNPIKNYNVIIFNCIIKHSTYATYFVSSADDICKIEQLVGSDKCESYIKDQKGWMQYTVLSNSSHNIDTTQKNSMTRYE